MTAVEGEGQESLGRRRPEPVLEGSNPSRAAGWPVCWCWPGRVRGEGWTCSGSQRVSG